MNRNAFKVPLLNRDGKINTEMLPNYDENDKLRADYANYLVNANNTKINVGSGGRRIYFSNGVPAGDVTTTIGSNSKPIYLNKGVFTACKEIPFYALIERTVVDKNTDTDYSYINAGFSWRHFGDSTSFNNSGLTDWKSLTVWNGTGKESDFHRIIYNGFVLNQSFSLSVRIDFYSEATDDRVIWIKSEWIESVLREATQSSLTISRLYYDIPIATPRVEQTQKTTPTTFTWVGPYNKEDQIYIGFDGGNYINGVNILITGQIN